MQYFELIDRALLQASKGLTPSQADLLMDADAIAESLVPSVFQSVGLACAADPTKRSLLKKTKTIAFTSGQATLDTDVLTQCTEDSRLYDVSNISQPYSWVREFSDFIDPQDSRLNYYNIERGGVIRVIENGDDYDPSGGFSGTLYLNIPCVPAVPTSSTATIDATEEVLSDLVEALAEAIRSNPVNTAQVAA